MKICLDLNPDNRPKATEIVELIELFHKSYVPGSMWLFGREKEQ
jgi:hypothetical protein